MTALHACRRAASLQVLSAGPTLHCASQWPRLTLLLGQVVILVEAMLSLRLFHHLCTPQNSTRHREGAWGSVLLWRLAFAEAHGTGRSRTQSSFYALLSMTDQCGKRETGDKEVNLAR